MRQQFAKSIYSIMKNNDRVVSVVVDSGTEELDKVRDEMSDRLVECGIAEANAIGVAAGLAASGAIPIVYGMGSFLVYRAMEFIRDDICLQNLNVKIVGSGGGVGYNNLGATHHTTEDIGVLRAIPNIKIFSPATPKEVIPIMDLAVNVSGPVYIRFGKAYEEEIFDDIPQVKNGKASIIRNGNDAAIICTGSIISDAVSAAEILAKDGIDISIINCNQLKPIDKELIIKIANDTKCILTVEEHNIIGGLHSIIAEVLAINSSQVIFDSIGFKDEFCLDYGWRQDLRKMYGISQEAICNKIHDMIIKKDTFLGRLKIE